MTATKRSATGAIRSRRTRHQTTKTAIAEYLAALHVHDNDGKRDLHWLPYAGVIDWAAFSRALHEIGFAGALSLETRVKPSMPMDIREYHEIGLGLIARRLAE